MKLANKACIFPPFLLSLWCAGLSAQDSGFFIGIGGGIGELEVIGHDRSAIISDVLGGAGMMLTSTTGSEDDDIDSWNIHTGYQFNSILGTELSYRDLGGSSGTFLINIADIGGDISGTLDSDYKALTAAATIMLPVFTRTYLTGKFGGHYWEHEFELSSTATGTPISLSTTDRGTGFLYGGGIAFRFTEKLSIKLLWERLDNIEEDDGVDVKSLSLSYYF